MRVCMFVSLYMWVRMFAWGGEVAKGLPNAIPLKPLSLFFKMFLPACNLPRVGVVEWPASPGDLLVPARRAGVRSCVTCPTLAWGLLPALQTLYCLHWRHLPSPPDFNL